MDVEREQGVDLRISDRRLRPTSVLFPGGEGVEAELR